MVEIIGKKVELISWNEENSQELYYWQFEEKEQEAKKWNGPYIPEKHLTKEEHRSRWMNEEKIQGNVPASLVITVAKKAIGSVSAYWVDKNTNWLETGIVIYDKEYWNGGYGSEAYQLWIDYLFTATDLHRLGMSTWSGNKRMMKVAEKMGMVVEARIRNARIVDGQLYDAIKMGMLREEWLEKHPQTKRENLWV